ncbi:hypothetical protein BJ122_102270 [Rhodopseudomonas faecalis]|uniref:Uncharacterized protein n=1 Tax=Rhodopseudomonas faecalis TaxID=99655 RepID=A0A318TK73_9BRAD|nr:hypothetical protein [Rhodopseudomonas faecalis]PYF05044.1 hypothetical protein BJ122_102270 [Rhodopseudomonas faecalis]
MTKDGFALIRDADHTEIGWWEVIPARIEIPGSADVVFGAEPGWSGAGYSIKPRTREFADPPDVDPALPRPIVPLSRRQFYEALARSQYITEAEALAAMAGVIPAPLGAAVDALAEQERFTARMLLAGGAEFRRDHPLVEIIGAAHGQSAAQIDAFFQQAAAL